MSSTIYTSYNPVPNSNHQTTAAGNNWESLPDRRPWSSPSFCSLPACHPRLRLLLRCYPCSSRAERWWLGHDGEAWAVDGPVWAHLQGWHCKGTPVPCLSSLGGHSLSVSRQYWFPWRLWDFPWGFSTLKDIQFCGSDTLMHTFNYIYLIQPCSKFKSSNQSRVHNSRN
jgi:hypothetical protein